MRIDGHEIFSIGLDSWQRAIRKYWGVAIIIVLLSVGMVIFLGYRLKWDWTGFPTKTLWDWFNLLGVLAIPVAVALGTAWFTRQQAKVSDAENKDNQRETALQAYIDKMSELLLEKELRKSVGDDEVRTIARVRTLTVLSGLDAFRKASVLQFLHESSLVDKNKPIIDLSGAFLNGAFLIVANLSGANLSEANLVDAELVDAELRGTSLNDANLSRAILTRANLNGANLSRADLSKATFIRANLREANLREANLSAANLKDAINITTKELEQQATSLKGATMPDGSIHS